MADGTPWLRQRGAEGPTTSPASACPAGSAAGPAARTSPGSRCAPSWWSRSRYDAMEGDRFRHTAQFERWRPDREPRSCGYDQLDRPLRFDVDQVLRRQTPTKSPTGPRSLTGRIWRCACDGRRHSSAWPRPWSSAAGCAVPVFAPRTEDAPTPAGGGVRHARADDRRGSARAWRPCPEVPRELVGRGAPNMTYECATSPCRGTGPSTAAGETFDIALLRARASDQRDRIGSLLVNPGGPGGSGIDTAVYLSFGEAFGGLPAGDHQPVRHRRLRPARGRPVQPGEVHLRRRPGRSVRLRPGPGSQAEFDERSWRSTSGSARAAAKYGDQLPLFAHRAGRPRHGRDPRRRGRRRSSPTSATRTARCSARRTPSCSRATCAPWCSTARSTRSRTASPARRARPRASSGRSTNFTNWCAANAGRCPIAPDARAARSPRDRQGARSPRSRGADGREATAGWVLLRGDLLALHRVGLAVARRGDRQPGRPATPAGVFDLADSYAEPGRRRPLLQPVRRQPRGQLRRRPRRRRTWRRSGSCRSEWRTKYPLFGPPLAVGMLTCVGLAGQARPVPDRAGRRRAADRGGRHDRRPGDAVRAEPPAGRDARRRPAC